MGAGEAGGSQRAGETPRDEEGWLHDRLVAYVHSLAQASRRGVWGEHSYARARGAAAAAGGAPRVRTLLAPAAPRPAPLDVVRAEPARRDPPAALAEPDDSDDTDAEEAADWEERLRAAALSPEQASLAAAATGVLRDMRLARLACAGRAARREVTRGAARRLRRALAPLWAGGAPAWLHAALARLLPRAERRLYDEALAELWRAVPRLAARLAGAPSPAAPVAASPAPVPPDSSPWLVWVSSGDAALDARWEPRLAALVHTRVLRGAGGAPGAGAAPPEPWCAGAAAAVRAALTDALAEAGSRAVILGGCGAGGAVLALLARGAGGAGRAEGGVRGLALVAPPLSTAEGSRDAADDALAGVRLPLLLVCGSRAAECARGAALRVAAAGERRVLEVRGADSRLRLPARLRAQLRLPQHALDAALAEEVVRWAVETAEREEEAGGGERRRAPPAPPAPPAEEYAHLPAGEAGEGRVVSRVTGGTPLLLAPPRAPPAAPAAPALAAADILQLPIVFADDEASGAEGSEALTVRSGAPAPAQADAVKFTRVILAKRGGPARRLLLRRPAAPRPAPRPAPRAAPRPAPRPARR